MFVHNYIFCFTVFFYVIQTCECYGVVQWLSNRRLYFEGVRQLTVLPQFLQFVTQEGAIVFECAVVLILIWLPEYASSDWRDIIPACRGIDSVALCVASAEWRNVTGAPTRELAVCENDRP